MTSVLDAPLSDTIDPRIRARRDEVTRARHQRRRRWRFAIAILLIVVGCAWLSTRTALLDVDHIEVAGATHTAIDDVHAASGVEIGDQLLDVDTGEIRGNLRALPWIADASVESSWGGELVIELRERAPLAMFFDADGTPMLVDREGHVLADASSLDPPVPATEVISVDGIVAGEPGEVLPDPAGDALSVVAALTPGLRSRVEALAISPDGQIELAVRPSGRVLFCGATDVAAKIQALQTLFAQVDDDGIATIDVCADQPTVTRVP